MSNDGVDLEEDYFMPPEQQEFDADQSAQPRNQ